MPISASGGWAGHGVTSDPVTRPTSAIDQVSPRPASPGLAASPVSACGHAKVSVSASAGSPTASASHHANVQWAVRDVLCPPSLNTSDHCLSHTRVAYNVTFKNDRKKQHLVPKIIQFLWLQTSLHPKACSHNAQLSVIPNGLTVYDAALQCWAGHSWQTTALLPPLDTAPLLLLCPGRGQLS